MGSAQEVAYGRLVRDLLRWPGMRERPEPDSPFGRTCARPSLRLKGARFATFHQDEARVLHVSFPVPPSLAEAIAEAEADEDGRVAARFSLAAKRAMPRALAVARALYEAREGRPPPRAERPER